MLTNSPGFHQKNLFGDDLLQQLDLIPWNDFDNVFGHHYSKNTGAPSKSIRLMAGLLLLKQLENLSDENVVLQ